MKFNENMSSLEALQEALKREQDAYNFYKAASESVKDVGAKKMFKFLAEEEGKHKNIIQDELDSGFYKEM